ncbi:MAG: hypothetical protein ABIO71_14105 [Caldimonas sp.]
MRDLLHRRVFVTEYVGLSTRLEALAMAFLIAGRHGHEVCIDWHELDALTVTGTRRRARGLVGRLDSLKLRRYTPEAFEAAARHRNVVLRTHEGPHELLEPLYLPTAGRVRLRPDLVETIRRTCAVHADRPLVGVHLRRGDFALRSEDVFDVNAAEWPAVPEWWYAHVMAEIRRSFPRVVFFVACTGSLDDYRLLVDFEVFDLPTSYAYDYKGPSHAARRDPAADLFALACCSVVIGTPCSTFSHYAADMLGAPTTLLLPPAVPMTRSAPAFCRADLHGRGAAEFYAACRTGAGLEPVVDAATLPVALGARVAWL